MAKKNSTPRIPRGKGISSALPALTRAQAEKAIKDNAAAYLAYQLDRGKGVERSKNKHGAGYKAYKVAYRALLEHKRAAGEITPRATKVDQIVTTTEAPQRSE